MQARTCRFSRQRNRLAQDLLANRVVISIVNLDFAGAIPEHAVDRRRVAVGVAAGEENLEPIAGPLGAVGQHVRRAKQDASLGADLIEEESWPWQHCGSFCLRGLFASS